MKYDDAAWHYDGEFPVDLPNEAGATHIGMFLAWMLLHGFGSLVHAEQSCQSLQKLKNREITGRESLFKEWNEKFTDEDLNAEGNLFAQYYYNGDGKVCQYLDDYDNALCANLESMYHVEDSLENYDKLASYIDAAYRHWCLIR